MLDLGNLLSKRWGRKIDLPKQVASYRKLPHDVLADLLEFTGVMEPMPLGADYGTAMRCEGRRDVGLRIVQHLGMSAEELYVVLRGTASSQLT